MLLDPGDVDGKQGSVSDSEYSSQYIDSVNYHLHPRLATYKVEAFLDPHTMRKGVTFFMLKRLAMQRGCQLIGWYRPRSEKVRDPGNKQAPNVEDSGVFINYRSAVSVNPANKCTQEVTFLEGDELLMLDQGIPVEVKIGVQLPSDMSWLSRTKSTLVSSTGIITEGNQAATNVAVRLTPTATKSSIIDQENETEYV